MLSAARHRQLVQGLGSTARKVFDLIPCTEPWTFNQITADVKRRGVSLDYSIMQGCVATLVDTGLVLEPARGSFVRAPFKKEGTPMANIMTEPMQKIVPNTILPAKPLSPIDRLSPIAAQLRNLGNAALAISEELDTIALEIEQRLGTEDAEMVKLRRLADALKAVNG